MDPGGRVYVGMAVNRRTRAMRRGGTAFCGHEHSSLMTRKFACVGPVLYSGEQKASIIGEKMRTMLMMMWVTPSISLHS